MTFRATLLLNAQSAEHMPTRSCAEFNLLGLAETAEREVPLVPSLRSRDRN